MGASIVTRIWPTVTTRILTSFRTTVATQLNAKFRVDPRITNRMLNDNTLKFGGDWAVAIVVIVVFSLHTFGHMVNGTVLLAVIAAVVVVQIATLLTNPTPPPTAVPVPDVWFHNLSAVNPRRFKFSRNGPGQGWHANGSFGVFKHATNGAVRFNTMTATAPWRYKVARGAQGMGWKLSCLLYTSPSPRDRG